MTAVVIRRAKRRTRRTPPAPPARPYHDELSRAEGRAAVIAASRDALLCALESTVALLHRIGGYMTADDQAVLRAARALLAEEGV